jgi:hypothetical protein
VGEGLRRGGRRRAGIRGEDEKRRLGLHGNSSGLTRTAARAH